MAREEEVKLSVTRVFPELPLKKERNRILREQKCKCAFCDIDIRKHSRMHPISETEHIGLCSICYHSQHIEMLNGENDGSIVMMTEFSQLELIVLSRTIELFKRLNIEEFSEDIDSSLVIRMFLQEGSNDAENYFAEGSSDIELVAQVLSNQTDENYEHREKGLYNLKWLPNFDSFSIEMDYWYDLMMKDKESDFHPSKWESLLQKMK